jgi:peptidoglycan hydrolase-like protein with peptidoglycan-binding domain
MIPAKAQVRTRGHLSLYALPVEDLLAYLGGEGSGPALVFVDACRNNTLPAEGKNARTDLLLSRRAGMFIGFATAEGTISNASDRGSLYTRSLAQRLLTPGMSLDDLYAGIIADVERATKDRASEIQPPEKQSALRFVLHMLPGGESPEVARMRAELDRLKNRLPEPVISVSARESARDLAELFENGPFAASSQTAQRGILRDIQAKLRESGDYDASIDGIPGPSTLRAVMGFQERNGMEITGRLDADTLKGLGITTLSKQLDGRPAGLELPEMGGKPSRGGAGAGGSEGSGIELTVPAPPQIKKSPGATILDAVDATIPAPPQIKNSPGAIIP